MVTPIVSTLDNQKLIPDKKSLTSVNNDNEQINKVKSRTNYQKQTNNHKLSTTSNGNDDTSSEQTKSQINGTTIHSKQKLLSKNTITMRESSNKTIIRQDSNSSTATPTNASGNSSDGDCNSEDFVEPSVPPVMERPLQTISYLKAANNAAASINCQMNGN